MSLDQQGGNFNLPDLKKKILLKSGRNSIVFRQIRTTSQSTLWICFANEYDQCIDQLVFGIDKI